MRCIPVGAIRREGGAWQIRFNTVMCKIRKNRVEKMEQLLQVEQLSVGFTNGEESVRVIDGLSFSLSKGETLGIVGESGSGKSVTSLAIMGLLPANTAQVSGRIMLNGEDLLAMPARKLQDIRGNKLSMIFQEPMTALNPVYTCGNQIMEAVRKHQKLNKKEAAQVALEMLKLVGIPMPEQRMKAYPHELSGGMRQRVMIAMALSCKPKLLIADEPTTALDPTIQEQILELIRELHQRENMSVMYITHDLGVIAETCHRVVVMYAGMIQEIAEVHDLFHRPLHPYTMGLMKAMPKLGDKKERLYDIKGVVPHITNMPAGCRFAPRCPHATERCHAECPKIVDAGNGHMVRCHQNFETKEG